ncbi:MAG TPA: hypothetical protein VLZ76_06255, partial [Lysobacter sp.]|nr:hypothetical protein [Lysobacter sp.]
MSTVRLEAVNNGKSNMDTLINDDAGARDIPMQPASLDIWDKKYRLVTKDGVPVDADIDATYRRVAKA